METIRAAEWRREQELKAAVERGDLQEINRLLPLDVCNSNDALAKGRARSLQDRAESLARNQEITVSDAIDAIVNESDEAILRWPKDAPDRDGHQTVLRLLKTSKASVLKPRERRAVRLWAEGMNQTQIAAKLRISQPTVHRIVQSAKAAMGIAL
jgi:DNA-binding CsgD family transcriptional regulator